METPAESHKRSGSQRDEFKTHGRTWLFSGGGFGASPSSKKSKNKKNQGKEGSNKKKKRYSALQELADTDEDSFVVKETEPILDKWGLPPPTLEDIFPPLSPEIELKPCNSEHKYGRSDIEKALEKFIPMGLEALFDEQGWERNAPKDRHPMQVKLMHESPPVLVVENFLTPSECLEVERVADLSLDSPNSNFDSDAVVRVNSATFGGGLSTRTSTSWFCRFSSVPTLVSKLHKVLGFAVEQMEEPQIVRYQNGQEFSWHYDEVPPQTSQLDNGGQRLATVLVYLNSLTTESGGATVFRDLRSPLDPDDDSNNSDKPLAVCPQQGRACIFFPAMADGTPDDRTLHKGERVQSETEEKRIVQVWIHERAYQPILPHGNTHDDVLPMIQ